MLDSTDISPANFRFDFYIGTSVRERFRDAIDAVIRRPLYKLLYGKKFAHLPYPVDLVLPEKGMSTLAKRQWVNRYVPLENSRILVIGCGTAWDFGSYLRFKPKEIVGVDLYNFSRCWQQVQDYVTQRGGPTKVSFYQADIAGIDSLITGNFDLIASDDVFEHCCDLEAVLKTLYGLLRKGGVMYAGYGPLWYTWGGDHFSGRGGIEQGYNHLILDSDAYLDYYKIYLKDEEFEVQNGGRYIPLALFSKLPSNEYFNLYCRTGFVAREIRVYFSRKASALRRSKLFDDILEKFSEIKAEDLLIKSHYVILEKPH